jgi:imidazolonepropionase-like amidohydrolase
MHDEEIHAAIDEATRLGVKVAAHTSGGDAIYKAVKEGLHTVEHGHWIDDKTADVMAEKGAYYVPTLLVNERNFDFGQKELGVSDAAWQWLERARADKWASLERIHRAGVNIAVGTDAGFMLPHGLMNAIELELLVEGGLTPLEAITAATKTSAALLDMPDVGSLELGKHADLVLVSGDPTQDVTLLQGDLRVFQAGKEVT